MSSSDLPTTPQGRTDALVQAVRDDDVLFVLYWSQQILYEDGARRLNAADSTTEVTALAAAVACSPPRLLAATILVQRGASPDAGRPSALDVVRAKGDVESIKLLQGNAIESSEYTTAAVLLGMPIEDAEIWLSAHELQPTASASPSPPAIAEPFEPTLSPSATPEPFDAPPSELQSHSSPHTKHADISTPLPTAARPPSVKAPPLERSPAPRPPPCPVPTSLPSRPDHPRRVVIREIPRPLTCAALTALVKSVITSSFSPLKINLGHPSRHAFIDFDDPDDVPRLIARLDGHKVYGQRLIVEHGQIGRDHPFRLKFPSLSTDVRNAAELYRAMKSAGADDPWGLTVHQSVRRHGEGGDGPLYGFGNCASMDEMLKVFKQLRRRGWDVQIDAQQQDPRGGRRTWSGELRRVDGVERWGAPDGSVVDGPRYVEDYGGRGPRWADTRGSRSTRRSRSRSPIDRPPSRSKTDCGGRSASAFHSRA